VKDEGKINRSLFSLFCKNKDKKERQIIFPLKRDSGLAKTKARPRDRMAARCFHRARRSKNTTKEEQ